METDENTLVPDDIPTLEPIPMDQNNHETIFINETKLTELKQDLQKNKIEVSHDIKKLHHDHRKSVPKKIRLFLTKCLTRHKNNSVSSFAWLKIFLGGIYWWYACMQRKCMRQKISQRSSFY